MEQSFEIDENINNNGIYIENLGTIITNLRESEKREMVLKAEVENLKQELEILKKKNDVLKICTIKDSKINTKFLQKALIAHIQNNVPTSQDNATQNIAKKQGKINISNILKPAKASLKREKSKNINNV